MIDYHDHEWGVPVHDDRRWFEFLILEGAQAGLSWSTILNKREAYRRVFDAFDPRKVATYTDQRLEKLRENSSIVRNRLKIYSARSNARAFLRVQEEFGSFDTFIWESVGGSPIVNAWQRSSQILAQSEESRLMSKELKRRGFNFVGPTICYAFMQATGLVNDHTVECFRYRQLRDGSTT